MGPDFFISTQNERSGINMLVRGLAMMEDIGQLNCDSPTLITLTSTESRRPLFHLLSVVMETMKDLNLQTVTSRTVTSHTPTP
jgi:hypothetical protein